MTPGRVQSGLSFQQNLRCSKSNAIFPELGSPEAQNAVKIVSLIFPVIYDKRNLRADFLFA